ncbi:invasion associated locus B family protein [Peteryoungia algae]|uniref:Invasion associated locus B family protein n=1 Tax=Peteryoungia algae TaxID=2919917 RepID=A0ABT0CU60_9HYPH|nr:invasion associated locus B family protein [Rhizobium sp. SSM4.3]MCJ8236706.1 invasion associated locus B family protein [Rhizobium sp. SSM4.3]
MRIGLSTLTIFMATFSAIGTHAAPLPGGAGSLTENYQDWVVACQAQNNATACVMRQVQSNSQTGQTILTAEFRAVDGDALEGALLLPFGLVLSQGVAVKIDETEAWPLSFSTCLPQGCLALISFDASRIASLKAGTALNLTVSAISPLQPIAFKISLKGFTNALGRIAELSK